DDKRKAVRQLVARRELSQALVFVNSKLGAARLARAFERDGLNTTALHGDKSQDERLKALDAFKRGDVQLLVATDVAARGLDIVDLPVVFNYDVPFNAEDYVHRIGRTGRAGQSGLSVTLVTRDDTRLVGDIERLIRKKIEIEPFDFDDERPRRAPRRSRDDDDDRRGELRAARSDERRAQPAPADPLFDRPYEPSSSAAPAWEVSQPAPLNPRRTVSANIKPRRKVASLLGGGRG
ncbi:MAG TPA: C-terminal helicase domain-containing protein, partial [Burkholderiaceae bacterium]|nr:C-terminal helicase domain-containing protein [Burkholderiaceae bacterium]